jgi:clan AA aspartic protease
MSAQNRLQASARDKLPGEKLILPGTTVGGDVGTFYVDFELCNMERTRRHAVNALVDTGASLTQVPASVLEELGIIPVETQRFILADGSRKEIPVGEARIELQSRFKTIDVIFGAEASNVLLGALALEAFGLAADARNSRLVPADMTL